MNRQEPPYYPYQDDEITLKELILKLRDFYRELWAHKFLILIVSTLLSLIYVGLKMRKPTTYMSAVTFMVGESDSKKGSVILPMDQIQYVPVQNHKLTEIARASQIVHEVLLSELDSSSNNRMISEALIERYDLNNETDIDFDVLNLEQIKKQGLRNDADKIAFNCLHELLVGNRLKAIKGLMSISYDDKTELFNMSVNTIDQNLSSGTLDQFYNILSDFYIDKTVGRPRRSYKTLVAKEDSLLRLLNSAENQVAYVSDRVRGVVSNVAKVNQSRAQRKLEQITDQYDELRISRQKVEYILESETPDFQIIDKTYIPIMEKASLPKSAIIGFILGTFLSAIFVIGRYIIRSAMTANE